MAVLSAKMRCELGTWLGNPPGLARAWKAAVHGRQDRRSLDWGVPWRSLSKCCVHRDESSGCDILVGLRCRTWQDRSCATSNRDSVEFVSV